MDEAKAREAIATLLGYQLGAVSPDLKLIPREQLLAAVEIDSDHRPSSSSPNYVEPVIILHAAPLIAAADSSQHPWINMASWQFEHFIHRASADFLRVPAYASHDHMFKEDAYEDKPRGWDEILKNRKPLQEQYADVDHIAIGCHRDNFDSVLDMLSGINSPHRYALSTLLVDTPTFVTVNGNTKKFTAGHTMTRMKAIADYLGGMSLRGDKLALPSTPPRMLLSEYVKEGDAMHVVTVVQDCIDQVAPEQRADVLKDLQAFAKERFEVTRARMGPSR